MTNEQLSGLLAKTVGQKTPWRLYAFGGMVGSGLLVC